MRSEQLSITFPKNKVQYKQELIRMKEEESLNVSNFILGCLEKEMGSILSQGEQDKFFSQSGPRTMGRSTAL